MGLHIAKDSLCLYNWTLFTVAHRGHPSDFSSPDWWRVTYSSRHFKGKGKLCNLCEKISSSFFPLVANVSSRVRGIIEKKILFEIVIFWWIHSKCLAIMSCYSISVYPPNLSTLGTRSFLILPLLASCLFMAAEVMGLDAVGALLMGSIWQLRDYPIRHWERGFSEEKELKGFSYQGSGLWWADIWMSNISSSCSSVMFH